VPSLDPPTMGRPRRESASGFFFALAPEVRAVPRRRGGCAVPPFALASPGAHAAASTRMPGNQVSLRQASAR
jgi:hypothetical protein